MTKQNQWLQHRHKVLVKLLLAAAASLSLVTALLTIPPSALAVYTGSGGTLNGDNTSETIIIDVSGGLLRHNRATAGDPGFNSDFDWDTTVGGDQTLPNSGIVNINSGGGDDVIILGSATSPASALAATFNINGGSQTVSDTLTIDNNEDTTGRTISVGSSTITGIGTLVVSYNAVENLVVGGSGKLASSADTFNLIQSIGIQVLLKGNQGADNFVFTNGVTLLQGTLDGGLDRDGVSYAAYTTPVTGTLNSTINHLTGLKSTASIANFIGGTNDDDVDGNPQDNLMDGRDGNDILSGLDGADTLIGGLGNDILSGGLLTDTLTGDIGNDTLNGDAGIDTLNGGADNDILNGGSENDTLNGDAGIDTLNGNAGIDTLNGGTENDTLNGGTENDSLTGGTGDDTYSFSNSWGNDTVTEAAAGGTADSMNFSAVTVPLDITISSVNVTDGLNVATHSGNEIETVVSGSGNDTFDVSPSALASHDISINGGPHPTGDVLNFNALGVEITPTTPTPPSGTITPSGGQTLSYTNFEEVNIVDEVNVFLPIIVKGS
jgi:Ca2+-binding RTX toxin-like protein